MWDLPRWKLAVLCGMAAIVLIGLIPPYQHVYPEQGGRKEFAGHRPVVFPPSPIIWQSPVRDLVLLRRRIHYLEHKTSVQVDVLTLLIEWIVIAAAAGGTAWLLHTLDQKQAS